MGFSARHSGGVRAGTDFAQASDGFEDVAFRGRVGPEK